MGIILLVVVAHMLHPKWCVFHWVRDLPHLRGRSVPLAKSSLTSGSASCLHSWVSERYTFVLREYVHFWRFDVGSVGSVGEECR